MTGSTLGRLLALAVVSIATVGCAPTLATRGNLVDDDRLGALREGVSRKDDVEVALGTPSSVGTFDRNTWYYIGQRTEKVAFFTPDVLERKVIVVHFDPAGVLNKIEHLDMNNAQDVEMVDRTTPTAGKDLGFFEQILGNVGRFGGTGKAKGPSMPGGGGIPR